MILRIPIFFNRFNVGSCFWTGKILGIIFGCLCYFIFNNHFIENNYFTIVQETKNIKNVLTISYIMILINCILSLYYNKNRIRFNSENALFQLTLPGIDEEIMFRGILLGLLLSSINESLFFINPSLLIISLLFGLTHGFFIDPDFSINFNFRNFIYIGIIGYIYGWVAIETKSILLPIVIHNLYNFFCIIFEVDNKEHRHST
jgi:membrane protease YdiL (CAAX protease family)